MKPITLLSMIAVMLTSRITSGAEIITVTGDGLAGSMIEAEMGAYRGVERGMEGLVLDIRYVGGRQDTARVAKVRATAVYAEQSEWEAVRVGGGMMIDPIST